MNENQWRSELSDVLRWSKMEHIEDQENCYDIHSDYANFYFSIIQQLGKPEQEFKVSMNIDDTIEPGEDTLIHYSIYKKKHEDWDILESDEYYL